MCPVAFDHDRYRFVDVAERLLDDVWADASCERFVADFGEPLGEGRLRWLLGGHLRDGLGVPRCQ